VGREGRQPRCYDLRVADLDLSFSRYVAARKGAATARAREGAHYAYGADLRLRSALDKLRPVTLAVEATLRFWQTVGRNRLVGGSPKVGEKQFPQVHKLALRAAEVLQIPTPSVYLSVDPKVAPARTLGTADEATIVLYAPLLDTLTDPELLFLIGHECGHIQNGHTIYLTASYFLTEAAKSYVVRWAVQPAILALNGWSRRADITCDRAGLLSVRDLAAATAALVKLSVGSRRLYGDIDVDEYLRQLDEGQSGPGRFHELFSLHAYLPKRVRALRLFADTTYYRSVTGAQAEGPGLSKEECDTKVGELLAVFR
jgi:Zn-dependent protease with chaperone function